MAKRNLSLLKSTVAAQTTVKEEELTPISLQLMNQEPPEFVKPLSATEKRRLAELELIITRNFKAFYEVGCALREILQKQLYRMTHATFADYVRDLWDLSRSRAYQLIDAVDVVDNIKQIACNNVHNCGQIIPFPQNECQARVLSKYPPEKQIVLWNAAAESAEKGHITAAHIRKTAKIIQFEKEKKAVNKARQAAPKIRMSEAFRSAFMAFMDAINAERMTDYKDTDMQEVLKALHTVTAAIEVEL